MNKTEGFLNNLRIFDGARLMLRYNINTKLGLVNGAMGNLNQIIWPHFRRDQVDETDIPNVQIKFDNIEKEQTITPRNVKFETTKKSLGAERRMLPLLPCYGLTVHKMQGSTVDRAVLDLEPAVFQRGQVYVALSRVRSLDGVVIRSLDCSKHKGRTNCNVQALEEMLRLRRLQEYNKTKQSTQSKPTDEKATEPKKKSLTSKLKSFLSNKKKIDEIFFI